MQSPAKKRARLDGGDAVARDATTSSSSAVVVTIGPDGLELLTSALVVARAVPQIAALPHVAASVSAFLDCSVCWTLEATAKNNDLRLLRHLVTAFKCPKTLPKAYPLFLRVHVFEAAKAGAELGHTDAIKLLHQIRPQIVCDYEVFAILADQGDLDMIQWLQDHCSFNLESEMEEAIEAAVGNDHIHVLQWIKDHRPAANFALAIEITVDDGHLEVVKWLYEHFPGNFSEYDMDEAAAGGHLEIVRFLHEHNIVAEADGCAYDAAVDLAAGGGHLEIVKFLYAKYPQEGCTTDAMDDAAANGHLEVVKFLHENRSEGYTVSAMDEAAANGHLEVVQFLHEHR